MRLSVQIEGIQGLTWPLWETIASGVEARGFARLCCCGHFARLRWGGEHISHASAIGTWDNVSR